MCIAGADVSPSGNGSSSPTMDAYASPLLLAFFAIGYSLDQRHEDFMDVCRLSYDAALVLPQQLENANLRALQDAGADPSAPPPYFNELLNHACTIRECLVLPGERRPLVLVLHASLQVRL